MEKGLMCSRTSNKILEVDWLKVETLLIVVDSIEFFLRIGIRHFDGWKFFPPKPLMVGDRIRAKNIVTVGNMHLQGHKS